MEPEHSHSEDSASPASLRERIGAGAARLLRGLDGIAGVAMLLVAGWLLQGWWVDESNAESTRLQQQGEALVLPAEPLPLFSAELRGSGQAGVFLIEYADFQCPYCARATEETIGPLIGQFVDTGMVRLAFQHVVLEQLHPFAVESAVAAECAGAQGHFWPMHDLLFMNQHRLHSEGLKEMAAELGLARSPFGTCLADSTMRESVLAETRKNKAMGIVSTPTFVVATLVSEDGPIVLPVEAFKGAGRREDIRRTLERLTR